MNLPDIFRDNAEDCAFLAERNEDGEVKRALKRMEEAWRVLAQEQEQLIIKDGQQESRPCEPANFFITLPARTRRAFSCAFTCRNFPTISEIET
jgi:hypothetical protein